MHDTKCRFFLQDFAGDCNISVTLSPEHLLRQGSVTLHPCGAPAPGHAAWLTGALGFTIPPAWLCHAVPPLHKGGFSLPQGIQRTWGNHSAWPVVFTQAKTAPLCKGSCRRTPTEGLPACLADDAHTRRLVSSICLCAINPPGMALPCCPPFAQGGLFFALRHTTDLGQSFSMAGCAHSGKESMGAQALGRSLDSCLTWGKVERYNIDRRRALPVSRSVPLI